MATTTLPTGQTHQQDNPTKHGDDIRTNESERTNSNFGEGQSEHGVAQHGRGNESSQGTGSGRSFQGENVGSRMMKGTSECASKLLNSEGMQQALNDVTGFIRRNPIPVIAVGVVVGGLIALAVNQMMD